MKLTTRSRYATRAFLDIAMQPERTAVPLKDIAKRQDISVQYLEQLVQPLILAGLVRTIWGSRGGVSLMRPPAKIRLIDILNATERPLPCVDCVVDLELCSRSDACAIRDLWYELQHIVQGFFSSMTLHDLVVRQTTMPK